jgi:malonate transporter and related proteins
MIAFFLLCLPIFGAIGVGYVTRRFGMIDAAAVDALGQFSFRIALPALAVRMLASQPIDAVFNARFLGAYLACGGFVFAMVYAVMRCTVDKPSAAAQATTASVSNLGFLGPPIMFAVFGEQATGPLSMAILAEILVLLGIGGILVSMGQPGKTSLVETILIGNLRNPVIGALVIGTLLATIGVTLPQPIDRFLGFLGAAAGPTALFALGATLAATQLKWDAVAATAGIATAKLVVYPLLTWLLLSKLLSLPPSWWQPGVVLSALPSSSSIFVLAMRYRAVPDRVSLAIAVTTLVSIITLPLTAWLVRG